MNIIAKAVLTVAVSIAVWLVGPSSGSAQVRFSKEADPSSINGLHHLVCRPYLHFSCTKTGGCTSGDGINWFEVRLRAPATVLLNGSSAYAVKASAMKISDRKTIYLRMPNDGPIIVLETKPDGIYANYLRRHRPFQDQAMRWRVERSMCRAAR
jgi:hypothetical protein